MINYLVRCREKVKFNYQTINSKQVTRIFHTTDSCNRKPYSKTSMAILTRDTSIQIIYFVLNVKVNVTFSMVLSSQGSMC